MVIVCRTSCHTWLSCMHFDEAKKQREKEKTWNEHCVITMKMRGCTFFNYVFRCQKANRRDLLGKIATAMCSQRQCVDSIVFFFFSIFKFIFNGTILSFREYRSGCEINRVKLYISYCFGHKLPHTYRLSIYHLGIRQYFLFSRLHRVDTLFE